MADSFQGILGEKAGGLHEISVCGETPHGEIGWRSLCFALCLFIYVFIICLFIACLCVCFLFTFTEPFVGFGGLVPFEREGGGVCSPAGLMEDVMKSLNSFLTYCYYCSYLFVLLLSIVSVYKPVC